MAQLNFWRCRRNQPQKKNFNTKKRNYSTETIAVIGCGVQKKDQGQAMNMRDAVLNVIVGQRKGKLSTKLSVGSRRQLFKSKLSKEQLSVTYFRMLLKLSQPLKSI
jgi:ketol-acid reductoisomerase